MLERGHSDTLAQALRNQADAIEAKNDAAANSAALQVEATRRIMAFTARTLQALGVEDIRPYPTIPRSREEAVQKIPSTLAQSFEALLETGDLFQSQTQLPEGAFTDIKLFVHSLNLGTTTAKILLRSTYKYTPTELYNKMPMDIFRMRMIGGGQRGQKVINALGSHYLEFKTFMQTQPQSNLEQE